MPLRGLQPQEEGRHRHSQQPPSSAKEKRCPAFGTDEAGHQEDQDDQISISETCVAAGNEELNESGRC